jgi:hypothetical protein
VSDAFVGLLLIVNLYIIFGGSTIITLKLYCFLLKIELKCSVLKCIIFQPGSIGYLSLHSFTSSVLRPLCGVNSSFRHSTWHNSSFWHSTWHNSSFRHSTWHNVCHQLWYTSASCSHLDITKCYFHVWWSVIFQQLVYVLRVCCWMYMSIQPSHSNFVSWRCPVGVVDIV